MLKAKSAKDVYLARVYKAAAMAQVRLAEALDGAAEVPLEAAYLLEVTLAFNAAIARSVEAAYGASAGVPGEVEAMAAAKAVVSMIARLDSLDASTALQRQGGLGAAVGGESRGGGGLVGPPFIPVRGPIHDFGQGFWPGVWPGFADQQQHRQGIVQ